MPKLQGGKTPSKIQGTPAKKNTTSTACNTCEERIEEGSKVECEACEKCYCRDCVGLSKQALTILNKTPALHWFCDDCNEDAMTSVQASFKNLIEATAKQCAELNERMESMEKRVEAAEGKAGAEKKRWENQFKALEERLEEREKGEESLPKAAGSSTVSDITERSVRELANREYRKSNIILFNVKECAHDSIDQVKEHDLNEIDSILQEINVAVDVKNAFRLGPKGENCRPLKVILGSEEQQTKALKSAKKLKETEDYSNIYINRDLTPLEQKQRKSLVVEMRQKKAAALLEGKADNYFIRNNQVVLGRPTN